MCDLVITNVSLPTLSLAFVCSLKLAKIHYKLISITLNALINHNEVIDLRLVSDSVDKDLKSVLH